MEGNFSSNKDSLDSRSLEGVDSSLSRISGNMQLRNRSNCKRKVESDGVQEDAESLSNKQRIKEVQGRSSNLSKLQKNKATKKSKTDKQLAQGLVQEEIASESIYGTQVTSAISPHSLLPGVDKSTNILDVPWDQLGGLCALGHTLAFIPRNIIPLIRDVFTFYFQKLETEPLEDSNIRKILLLPIVLFCDLKRGPRRGSLRDICLSLLKDDWSDQIMRNFPGRHQLPNPNKKPRSKVNLKSPQERQDARRFKRVVDLAHSGELSKALKALMNQKKSVSPSLEVAVQLREKFYPRKESSVFDSMNIDIDPPFQFILTSDQVKQIVFKMHGKVHPGHDNKCRHLEAVTKVQFRD